MSSYHEAVKRVLSEFNKFLKVTLQSETLSSAAENERSKILKLLQKLFADYDSLAPNSGDEGSISSSLDESRNTVDSSHGSEEDSYTDNIPATMVRTLTEPTKMGYMDRKQGILGVSTWQKRYCVLHKTIFYIFKKPTDKKQQGAFYITGYEIREAPHLVKDEKKKDCCFELVCPGKKSYQFLCESKDDLQSWKEVLQAALSNSPVIDHENDIDIYEEFNEVAAKSVTKSPVVDELYDDAATDKVPVKLPQVPGGAALKAGQTPSKAVPVQLNQNLKGEPQSLDVNGDDDDDLVYEPIDSPGPFNKPDTSAKTLLTASTSPPPRASPKVAISLPPVSSHRDETLPPPVPPHRDETLPPPVPSLPPPVPSHKDDQPPPPIPPHSRRELPLPPPPEDLPPPLPQEPAPVPTRPSGQSLPPPPTEPLPAVPQTPKKVASPSLGKILHPSEDFENLFYGKWDCTGSTDHELSFKRGQIVHIISRDLDKDNWWVGVLEEKIGLVPKNYLSPAYELIC